jgi:hypothetical protein
VGQGTRVDGEARRGQALDRSGVRGCLRRRFEGTTLCERDGDSDPWSSSQQARRSGTECFCISTSWKELQGVAAKEGSREPLGGEREFPTIRRLNTNARVF